MIPGSIARYTCPHCGATFDIHYEPTCLALAPAERVKIPDVDVTVCPYCTGYLTDRNRRREREPEQ